MDDYKRTQDKTQQQSQSKDERLVEIQKKIDELCAEREKLKSAAE